MRKGIIMDIEGNLLIMMTPEGEFLKGEKRRDHSYQIGNEIFFLPIQEEKKERKKFLLSSFWKVASVATAFLTIISIVSAVLFQNEEAYAYVSVDINPSMELSVNHDREVMEITPFNKDAEKVISQLNDWKGEGLEAVTEKIIKECDELGFLTENHAILIASVFTSFASRKDVKAITNELTSFEKSIEKETNTSITYKKASSQERKEAKEKGMTVAKLMKEKAKASGAETDSKNQKEKDKDEKDSTKSNTPPPEQKSPDKSLKEKQSKGDNEHKKDRQFNGENNHKKEKHRNEQNKYNRHDNDKSKVNNGNQPKGKNHNVKSQHQKTKHPANQQERKAKKQEKNKKHEKHGSNDKGHGKQKHKQGKRQER